MKPTNKLTVIAILMTAILTVVVSVNHILQPLSAKDEENLKPVLISTSATVCCALLTVSASWFIFAVYLPKRDAKKFAQELFTKFMTDPEFTKARLVTQQYLEPGLSSKYDECCHMNFRALNKHLLKSGQPGSEEKLKDAAYIRMITSFFYAVRLAQNAGLIDKNEKIFSDVYAYYWTNIIVHRILPCIDEDFHIHKQSSLHISKDRGQFRFMNGLASDADLKQWHEHFNLRFKEWESRAKLGTAVSPDAALTNIQTQVAKWESDIRKRESELIKWADSESWLSDKNTFEAWEREMKNSSENQESEIT